MKSFSVYLIEAGFPADPPVFLPDTPSAGFPFWGHYCFFDFAALNLSELAPSSVQIAVDPRFRSFDEAMAARFHPHMPAMIYTEGGLRGFASVIEKDHAERILLYPLSLLCLIDKALPALLERPAADLMRLSVDNTAMDLYLVSRKALLRLLKAFPAPRRGAPPPLAALFAELLPGSFEVMENLDGLVLFHNSLLQLYQGNLWLVERLGSAELLERTRLLNRARTPEGDIRIEKSATVRSSFLAAGTVVEGYVEGSVLFPGVAVRKGAVICNSIVMNNNRIGAKAQLYKTLVLPSAENGKGLPNIGEESFIGLRQSTAANAQYPGHVREGITVLGANPEIPKGYAIGPGCLVGAQVPAQKLKAQKEMRKGSTYLCDTGR